MSIIADDHKAEMFGDALRSAGYLVDSSTVPGGFRGKNVWALLTREGRPATAIIYPPGKANAVFLNMQKLWQSSFGERRSSSGLPEPIEYLPEIDAVITERCDGPSLADPSRLTDENIVEAIHLLASLHDCDAQPETRRTSRAILRSMQRKAKQICQHVPQHRDCVARLVEAMEAARTRDSELVPSHGNFRPECVIATARGLRFVEWGRFQWADPCRDLASFGTATWKAALMRGRMPERALLKRVVAIYETARPAAKIRKQLSFHVAASLLRLACILAESKAAEVYLVPILANLALRELE